MVVEEVKPGSFTPEGLKPSVGFYRSLFRFLS